MHIHVTRGCGTGVTKISAFDSALKSAGIANYNLLPLSSIVPPGSDIVIGPPNPALGKWGDRLYVVISSGYVLTPGLEIWSGLGWCQKADGSGLFVEYADNKEYDVKQMIFRSILEMAERRSGDYGSVEILVQQAKCVSGPACAIVAAVFVTEVWY